MEDSILAETHSFRKFFASYQLKHGNDVANVSAWFGHAKQSATLDHYSLVIYDDESLVQTNNLMADLIPHKVTSSEPIIDFGEKGKKMSTNKDTTANTSTQYVTINAMFPIHNGAVAQLGERFNGIEEVRSSSLLSSTNIN